MSEIVEYVEEVAGIYFRSILLPRAGMMVPQHAHDHAHATYVGSGRVLLYVDGIPQEEYEAGRAVAVSAGKQHAFQALENNTRLACVHDVASALSIKQKGL